MTRPERKRRIPPLPCLLFAATVAASAAAGQDMLASPTGNPAAGLLCAPVQSTWAANHVEHWRGLGFRGFILQGICDDLAIDVWARDGDPYSADEDDALLKEVRLACSRLAESGIDRHFALMRLDPDAPWFLDDAIAGEALRRVAAAGRFCRLARLRGLALDSDSLNPLYTYTWEGYDPDKGEPERLAAGARKFGQSVLRTFVKEFPDAELLVIADSVREAGPLWYAFFGGLIEGIGAADSVRIHLLTRESALECRPEFLVRVIEDTSAQILRRCGADMHGQWERFGSVALGLRPLGVNEAGPIAYCTPDAFRMQVAAAKTSCARYFWIDSPSQAWWQVAPEQAEQYRALYQAGMLAAEQSRPTLPELDAYSLKSPLDALERIGPVEWKGSRCDVFRGANGPAVLFWWGHREPLRTSSGQELLRVVELGSGKERSYSVGESEVGLPPAESAVLVEPLPESEWLLPAALRAEVCEPLASYESSARLVVGVFNPLDGVIHGSLQAWAPEGFSLGTATFPLELAPGAMKTFERALRGMREPRCDVRIDLTMALPESRDPEMRSIRRRFAFDVAPAAQWEQMLDGPPLENPVVGDVNGDGVADVLATDRNRTACYDANGVLRWETRWRATPAIAAQPVRGRLGAVLVAAVDRWGMLRTLDGAGRSIDDKSLGVTPASGAVLFADLYDSGADVAVVGDELGSVSCFTIDGEPLWRTPVHAPPNHITWSPTSGQVLVSCIDGAFHCLDREGKPEWQTVLAGSSSCAPIVRKDGDRVQVLVGTANGHVQIVDAGAGQPGVDWVVAYDRPVTAMCVADVFPDSGAELLAGSDGAVLCLNSSGQPVWKADVADVRGIAAGRVGGQSLVAVSGGSGVWAYSGDGRLLWRDRRAAWGVPGSLVLGDFRGARRTSMVYAGGDGILRWIELGPEERPRPVGEG